MSMRHRFGARGVVLAALASGICCRGPIGAGIVTSPAVASYDVGAGPRAIATADLNGDGHLDVVVANAGDGTATVLLGDGQGRLGAAFAPIAAGPEPADVEAVDLDRDGDADLVFANHETSRISVLLNDGRGRFAAAPGSPIDTGARPHVHGLAAGDFDGDGWTDVAVESADSKEVRVLRGGPRGLAAAAGVAVGTMPYYRLGAADVAGDGGLDVLVPGHSDHTVRVVHGERGRLKLAPLTLRLAAQPWMVAGGDLNGDRRADIVVVESDGVSMWLAGTAGFHSASGSPVRIAGATEVAIGDLDGDGLAEIAVAPWDGDQVTILAAPNLSPRKVRTCERSIGLAIADLDGDGRGELLAACGRENRLVVVVGAVGLIAQ